MAAAISCIFALPGEARSSAADWAAPYTTANRPAAITSIKTGLILSRPSRILAHMAALTPRAARSAKANNPNRANEAAERAPRKVGGNCQKPPRDATALRLTGEFLVNRLAGLGQTSAPHRPAARQDLDRRHRAG